MSRIGTGFGCAAMVIIAAVPMPFVLFVWAWSGAHCEPVPRCQRQTELATLLIIAAVLIIAIPAGFGTRRLLDRKAAKWSGDTFSVVLFAAIVTVSVSAVALLVMYVVSSPAFWLAHQASLIL